MTEMKLESYAVWDRPTRWFHWINFVCVIALAAIGTAILFDNELGVTDEGKILLKTTHVWFGYVFAVNLAWRFAWAFIGNRHASWSAILPFRTGYGAAFATYVTEVLVPELRPGDVVVWDNLQPHRQAVVVQAVEAAGATVQRLPPHSPDLTPIEKLWSKAKEELRALAARTVRRVYGAVATALKGVTPQDILGWFRSCGLCPTQT